LVVFDKAYYITFKRKTRTVRVLDSRIKFKGEVRLMWSSCGIITSGSCLFKYTGGFMGPFTQVFDHKEVITEFFSDLD